MKKNPLHDLTDEEVASRRKEYLLWGMVPAVIFILLEIYITFNPKYKGMEPYIFLGVIATFPFIFRASKYSAEAARRRKKEANDLH